MRVVEVKSLVSFLLCFEVNERKRRGERSETGVVWPSLYESEREEALLCHIRHLSAESVST